MFAALIPLAAQILAPIAGDLLKSVTSGLTQQGSSEKSSATESDKNFQQQNANNDISGLLSQGLGSLLGGLKA